MTQNNTMREIVIQYNSFLDVVKIVLVFGIMSNDKKQVKGASSENRFTSLG